MNNQIMFKQADSLKGLVSVINTYSAFTHIVVDGVNVGGIEQKEAKTFVIRLKIVDLDNACGFRWIALNRLTAKSESTARKIVSTYWKAINEKHNIVV